MTFPPPFRLQPDLPVTAYKTYSAVTPLETHFRPATCREVECEQQQNGWRTCVDTSTDLGARQANYIRLHSGRAFTVIESAPLVTFVFPAGQECFRTHRVRQDKPEIYVARDGDWRGNPTGRRRIHANGADWLDDFATHQDQITTLIQRG